MLNIFISLIEILLISFTIILGSIKDNIDKPQYYIMLIILIVLQVIFINIIYLKQLKAKFIFFSKTGLFLLVLGLFFSFHTNNLFIIFTGHSIIAFSVFFTCLQFFVFIKKKNIRYKLYVVNNNFIPLTIKQIKFTIDPVQNFFNLIGMRYFLQTHINNKTSAINEDKIYIKMTDNDIFIGNITFLSHGRLKLTDNQLIISDFFNITKQSLSINDSNELIIRPVMKEKIHLPCIPAKGGDYQIQQNVTENSTDFFENRKYYPGDDTRRINWKIYAHSTELHIREVEKIPPHIGKINLLYAPDSNSFIEKEAASGILVSTVIFLLEKGYEIDIYTPFNKTCFILNHENYKKFDNFILNTDYTKSEFSSLKKVDFSIVISTLYSVDILNKNKILNNKMSISIISETFQLHEKTLWQKLIFANKNENLIKDILNENKIKRLLDEKDKLISSIINNYKNEDDNIIIYKVDKNEFY